MYVKGKGAHTKDMVGKNGVFLYIRRKKKIELFLCTMASTY